MMLIAVPLMIWSARTEIDSQACSARHGHPGQDRREHADQQGGRRAEERRSAAPSGIASSTIIATMNPTKAAGEHHPLDADVDDAAPLAHDAAERAQGDAASRRAASAPARFVVTSWSIR